MSESNTDIKSSIFNHINYNIPIWLLNVGFLYIVTTLFYFIMNKINDDPVIEILEPFPKLKEHYKDKVQYTSRNLFLGLCIGVGIIYFFKPFGTFF